MSDKLLRPLSLTQTWLTPKEAAQYLKISTRTLQQWRTSKTGPHYEKRGQLIRYHTHDLDQWMRKK